MPDRYVKKPIEIEAMRWDPSDPVRVYSHAEKMRDWLNFSDPPAKWRTEGTGADCTIFVETLEGEMRCNPGDWIIRGIRGEFYPCKPDIFDATYQRVGLDLERQP